MTTFLTFWLSGFAASSDGPTRGEHQPRPAPRQMRDQLHTLSSLSAPNLASARVHKQTRSISPSPIAAHFVSTRVCAPHNKGPHLQHLPQRTRHSQLSHTQRFLIRNDMATSRLVYKMFYCLLKTTWSRTSHQFISKISCACNSGTSDFFSPVSFPRFLTFLNIRPTLYLPVCVQLFDPMLVIKQHHSGAYILAELNDAARIQNIAQY